MHHTISGLSNYEELEENVTKETGHEVTPANLTTFLSETTDTFNDLFPFGCYWFGKDSDMNCSKSWFTEVYAMYQGKCFSFNYQNNVRDFIQVQTGAGNGLNVFLNVNHSEYTGIYTTLQTTTILNSTPYHKLKRK